MNISLYNKELAKNIRVLRAERKISQAKLAMMASISPEAIGQIEREVGNPTLYTVVSIALALKVDLNTLLPINMPKK